MTCPAYAFDTDGNKYSCARTGEHVDHWTGVPGFFVSQWVNPALSPHCPHGQTKYDPNRDRGFFAGVACSCCGHVYPEPRRTPNLCLPCHARHT